MLRLYLGAITQSALYLYKLPRMVFHLESYPAFHTLHTLPAFWEETDEQLRMFFFYVLAWTLGDVSLTIVACLLWLIIYRYHARI